MPGFRMKLLCCSAPPAVLAALLFVFTVLPAAAEKVGTITFLLGGREEIQVKPSTSQVWSPARLKAAVMDGDMIKTLVESRCEITLTDGTIIRIGENSSFHFIDVNLKKQVRQLRAELPQGEAWVNASTAKAGKKDFQLKAPTAVCAIRGTIYDVAADSATTCKVYDGKVEVGPVTKWSTSMPREARSGPPQQVQGPVEVPGPFEVTLEEWQQIVRGQQIVVRKDGKFAKSLFDQKADSTDEWVKWNKELDAKAKK
ncbi:MAG TPA: FecR family protein [bacterium]|nr:FecR family protein [bacterium]HOH07229.1 FecR family protein [bacterium]